MVHVLYQVLQEKKLVIWEMQLRNLHKILLEQPHLVRACPLRGCVDQPEWLESAQATAVVIDVIGKKL